MPEYRSARFHSGNGPNSEAFDEAGAAPEAANRTDKRGSEKDFVVITGPFAFKNEKETQETILKSYILVASKKRSMGKIKIFAFCRSVKPAFTNAAPQSV